MIHGFREFTIGGVLLAPFVPQAAIAFALFMLLGRPMLRLLPIAHVFANPPLIGVCLYVIILTMVMIVY